MFVGFFARCIKLLCFMGLVLNYKCCYSLFLFLNRSLVVVHFWAPWAPQCAQMNDVMAALAKEHTQVAFVKVSQAVELVLNRREPLVQSMSKLLQNKGKADF